MFSSVFLSQTEESQIINFASWRSYFFEIKYGTLSSCTFLNRYSFKPAFQFKVAKEVQENIRNLDTQFKGTSVFEKISSWWFGELNMDSDEFPYYDSAIPLASSKGKLSLPSSSEASMVHFPPDEYSRYKISFSITEFFQILRVSLGRETPVYIHCTLGWHIKCELILCNVHNLLLFSSSSPDYTPVRGDCDLPNKLSWQIYSLMNNT